MIGRVARLMIFGCMLTPLLAVAQNPWTVALTPTMNPLPIGGCARIDLTLVDPRSRDRDVPRNALGQRVTIGDFDITLQTPNGTSAALLYRGEYHVEACGCQRSVPGTVVTVTATYPAVALDEKARVPGVGFEKTASFELSAPKGASNPPECERLASAPIRQRPSTVGTVERSAPRAAVPAPVAQIPIAPPAPRRTITASPINLVGTGFTGKVVRTITASPINLVGTGFTGKVVRTLTASPINLIGTGFTGKVVRTITASPINLVGTGFTGKVVRTITASPIVLHGQ